MWFEDALCWSEDSFCFWSFYVWLLHNGVLRCCLVELGLPWAPEQISGRLELERRNEFFLGPRGGTTIDRMIFREPGNWGRERRRAGISWFCREATDLGFYTNPQHMMKWGSCWPQKWCSREQLRLWECLGFTSSKCHAVLPEDTRPLLRICTFRGHVKRSPKLTGCCLFVFIQCLLPKQLMSHILNRYPG